MNKELKEFPDNYKEICMQAISVKHEIESLKNEIEIKYAELDIQVRQSPKKLTENAIKNEIILNKSYIELNNTLSDLKLEYDKYVVIKNTLEYKFQILMLEEQLKNDIKKVGV
jgi:hypothetical protein